MVLPISGFLPVPLPMMIPFMGAQSLVIGKMFGEGFQYGKRKISAMPNEEFNKLTFEAIMSNARSEMQASIPTMQAALQDMKPMVETVVHEFTNYLSLVIESAPKQAHQIKESLEDASGFTALNDKLVDIIAKAQGLNQSQDALGDILVALGLQRFGDQPALGEDLGKVGIQLTTAEDTHEKRVELQRLQTIKNEADKRRIELAKEKALRDVSDVTPIVQRGFTRKRPAGQSQRLAKADFIRKLREWEIVDRRLKGTGSTGRKIRTLIRQTRQKLADLLARYQF